MITNRTFQFFFVLLHPYGGIGRRACLENRYPLGCVGSNPTTPTREATASLFMQKDILYTV